MPGKRQIDLARVVQVALALADEQGFEAVTLADVAAQLGIRIPSLYNYIANLQGLRHEMTLWGVRQLGDQLRRAAVGKAGEDAILALATAYRAFAHAHPGIYSATQRAPKPDEPDIAASAQEIIDIVAAVLQPYGFSGDETIHAIRALRSVLHGFVDLETSGGFGLSVDRDESFQHLMKTYVRGLPAPHSRLDASS